MITIVTWFKSRDDLRKYFDFLRQNWALMEDKRSLSDFMWEILRENEDVRNICIPHSEIIDWFFKLNDFSETQLFKNKFDANIIYFDDYAKLPELDKWNLIRELVINKSQKIFWELDIMFNNLEKLTSEIEDKKKQIKFSRRLWVFLIPQASILLAASLSYLFWWDAPIWTFMLVSLWALMSSIYSYDYV